MIRIGFISIYLFASFSSAQEAKTVTDPEVVSLQLALKEIQSKLPDQAHAMADAAYHFSNLWFAGQAGNWPLAEFYVSETKSHLRWAVRLKPVRSISNGGTLQLADLLSAIEGGTLKEVEDSLKAKDQVRFEKGYKAMLASCYSCHVAAEKPFLKLHVPTRPPETMIEFQADLPGSVTKDAPARK